MAGGSRERLTRNSTRAPFSRLLRTQTSLSSSKYPICQDIPSSATLDTSETGPMPDFTAAHLSGPRMESLLGPSVY
jgi:hypothetical protein